MIGPWVAPYEANEIDLANALKEPVLFGGSWKHPLGTDDLGRDVLSRLIDGARVALLVSLAVVVIAGIVGLGIALIAGYRGGRLDAFLMRTTDASLAFPVLLFAIVVVGVFGPSTKIVIIVLAIAFWPSYARVLRSEVLQIKTMDYVTMARTMGGSGKWVITPAHPPEHRADPARAAQPPARTRHHRRGVAQLPRPRGAGAGGVMGRHARRRAQAPLGRVVDADDARHRPQPHRARHQLDG